MAKIPKKRLDQLLVHRDFVQSLEEAQPLIRAGKVVVNEQVSDKPGVSLPENVTIRIKKPKTLFAGRGGIKLEGALKAFQIDVNDMTVADFGASTGGFTDCLLKRGAKKVYAIDVGHGQLVYRLQTDPRVVVMDRTNCRFMEEKDLGEQVDLLVADLSFISLKTVFPAIQRVLKPGGDAVLLVKPQFEIAKGRVGKKGIVKQFEDHVDVLLQTSTFVYDNRCTVHGFIPSPIQGKSGNIEFLMHLSDQPSDSPLSLDTIRETVTQAHSISGTNSCT